MKNSSTRFTTLESFLRTQGDLPCIRLVFEVRSIDIILHIYMYRDMGVSKNRGTPKWMVYNGKLIKMDDFGVPLFLETPICLRHRFLKNTWPGVFECRLLFFSSFHQNPPFGNAIYTPEN